MVSISLIQEVFQLLCRDDLLRLSAGVVQLITRFLDAVLSLSLIAKEHPRIGIFLQVLLVFFVANVCGHHHYCKDKNDGDCDEQVVHKFDLHAITIAPSLNVINSKPHLVL